MVWVVLIFDCLFFFGVSRLHFFDQSDSDNFNASTRSRKDTLGQTRFFLCDIFFWQSNLLVLCRRIILISVFVFMWYFFVFICGIFVVFFEDST